MLLCHNSYLIKSCYTFFFRFVRKLSRPTATIAHYNGPFEHGLRIYQRSVNLEKNMVSLILPKKKKRTKLTILSTECAQDSEFCSFLLRIQDATISFRDSLTFSCIFFYTEHWCTVTECGDDITATLPQILASAASLFVCFFKGRIVPLPHKLNP